MRCLRQLRDALQAHGEEMRDLTTAEVGAPTFLTHGPQYDVPVADLGFAADLAESYEWRTDLGEAAPWACRRTAGCCASRSGVVGAITPWNFPHQINLAKLGPALAAGCTVVLKAAPDTPWAASAVGRIIATETDIPAGVVNVVTSVGPRGRGPALHRPAGRPGVVHRLHRHRPEGDGRRRRRP